MRCSILACNLTQNGSTFVSIKVTPLTEEEMNRLYKTASQCGLFENFTRMREDRVNIWFKSHSSAHTFLARVLTQK